MNNLQENLRLCVGNLSQFPSYEMREFRKRCKIPKQNGKPFTTEDTKAHKGKLPPRLFLDQSPPTAAASTGTARSYSHSLFGQAMTGPDFKNFSTKYSLPQAGHFSGIGLWAEVNLHLG